MKILIVYDSVFGNTEQVASVIGKALKARHSVEVVRATDAGPIRLEGIDLLIVGSPTRQFRPTPAITSYLDSIPNRALVGVRTAAFDTRIEMGAITSRLLRFFVRAFGYAAAPIAERLGRRGGAPTLPPEGFIVTKSEGPLKSGELERAAGWAALVLEAAAPSGGGAR